MRSHEIESTPVLLGKSHHLFGIVTVNRNFSVPYGTIILNAGLLHNVGPYRLHVDLAEHLSLMGLPVIRLDQSGKGESPKRPGKTLMDSVLMDYDDAFAELEDLGVRHVIIIGLCAGADDGLFIASRRDNVTGLVLLDGYAKRSWRYTYRHYAGRLLDLSAWARTLERMDWRTIFRDKGALASSAFDIRNWPSDTEMQRRLTDVLDKETKMLSIFSGDLNYYNHLGQLAASLPKDCKTENIREMYFDDVDHTYSIPDHRDRLVITISDWVRRSFPVAKPDGRS